MVEVQREDSRGDFRYYFRPLHDIDRHLFVVGHGRRSSWPATKNARSPALHFVLLPSNHFPYRGDYIDRWRVHCSRDRVAAVAIAADDEHHRLRWPNVDCECAPP